NHGSGADVAALESRLRLPSAVVQRILIGMRASGWLARTDNNRWHATESGRFALQHRHYTVQIRERRVFPFLECADASGHRRGPAHFVPMMECVHVPWTVDEAHRFDP